MNRELLKQVLDALKLAVLRSEKIIDKEYDAAITALEAELEKPDQKAELGQAQIALRIKEEEHKCCAEDLLRWRKSAESAIQENVELRAELSKPDPEPVAWVHVADTKMPWDKTLPYKFAFVKDESWACAVPLYAIPLRSPTDAELVELACDSKNCEGNSMLPVAFAREVEALVTGTRNCSRHPAAPHGFDRNGSHAAGRYMCECENWAPGEAS